MIIRFNKSPGAYIAHEYPMKISERLEIQTTDLMNIYAIHRMRRTDPNYNELLIKGIRMASFFTGYTLKNYVGLPDVVVTILLSDDYVLPKDFEWILRNFALQVIPKIVGEDFQEELINSFKKLKDEEIEALPHEEGPPTLVTGEEISTSKDMFTEIKDEFEESLNNKIVSLEKLVIAQKTEIRELKETIEKLKREKVPTKPAKVKPSTAEHDKIREEWVSCGDFTELESEISKINMNVIRKIVNPWNLKPSGRTKKDLINAVIDYCKKK
jgi:hypothetical protein